MTSSVKPTRKWFSLEMTGEKGSPEAACQTSCKDICDESAVKCRPALRSNSKREASKSSFSPFARMLSRLVVDVSFCSSQLLEKLKFTGSCQEMPTKRCQDSILGETKSRFNWPHSSTSITVEFQLPATPWEQPANLPRSSVSACSSLSQKNHGTFVSRE